MTFAGSLILAALAMAASFGAGLCFRTSREERIDRVRELTMRAMAKRITDLERLIKFTGE